jgi:uncharacterized tellurite resistance protein B-like protein
MESAKLLKGLFGKLHNESSFVSGEGGGHTQLTPHLSLVVSILYMMVADGEISDQESSQLQSVIGNNENVLKRALHYVETTNIEKFLKDVPAVLDSQDSLCILMNVCDSIMADGQMAEVELNLFERLTSALGHSKKTFKPYFKTISIKNKKSVLGSFEKIVDREKMSPQKALAVSLLYMMSADGTMAEEEIGQLNVVIGGSDGLLQAGLKYVRKIKFQQFIAEAASILNPAQQLCILTNVCDSMMSDGEVAAVELDLFNRMLTAFGTTEEKFQSYFSILSRKNNKPVEKDGEDSFGAAIPAYIKKVDEQGVSFDRKMSRHDKNIKATGMNGTVADDEQDIGEASERSELGTIINRKMQDNINKMSASIEGEHGIEDITDNANSRQENGVEFDRVLVDKNAYADKGSTKDSIHYVDEAAAKESIHYLDDDASKDSVHYLDHDAAKESIHYLDNDAAKSSIHYLENDVAKATAIDTANADKKINVDAARRPLQKRKKNSGPVKHRTLKDNFSLIAGKAKARKNNSPSDLRVISDGEFDFDGSPVEQRMTVVQTRTTEIMQNLDRLDSVNPSHFKQRGRILTTISFSPASYVAQTKTDDVLTYPLSISEPIQLGFIEEFHMAANNPALENSAPSSVMAGLKMKLAAVFTTLIIAHGFSSFGESTSQQDLIRNGNLATNAHLSLQAMATQQTMYRLAADDLDSSIAKKDFANPEQQELVQSRLASYLKKIEDQESAPATRDGKKELTATRKLHETLEATDSIKIQWFVIAKALLLFGIGLSVCGFFFRSRFIFYGASLTAVLGSLLTVNGFFLMF